MAHSDVLKQYLDIKGRLWRHLWSTKWLFQQNIAEDYGRIISTGSLRVQLSYSLRTVYRRTAWTDEDENPRMKKRGQMRVKMKHIKGKEIKL